MWKSEPSLRNEQIKNQNLSQIMRFYQLQDSNNYTISTNTTLMIIEPEESVYQNIVFLLTNAITVLRVNSKLDSMDEIKKFSIQTLRFIVQGQKQLVGKKKTDMMQLISKQKLKIPESFQLIHQKIPQYIDSYQTEISKVSKRIKKIQQYINPQQGQQRKKITKSSSFVIKRFQSRERPKGQEDLLIKIKQTERSSSEKKQTKMLLDEMQEKKISISQFLQLPGVFKDKKWKK